jgi:hypothetical protein
MHKQSLTANGFGLLVLLIIMVALILVGCAGAYVYHQDHKTKTTTASTVSSKSSTKTGNQTTTAQTDPYAGWKSYCDTTYHYCFKYPTDWTFDAGELVSPSKMVKVDYQNPDNRDGGPLTFTPTYIQKLTSANQDLTVVGGYYPTTTAMGSVIAPIYSITDSSQLTTSPLKVDTQGQYVGNPIFTDAGASTTTYGAMTATPDAASIKTTVDAQTWLDSADAKTSLQILQSFYYQ